MTPVVSTGNRGHDRSPFVVLSILLAAFILMPVSSPSAQAAGPTLAILSPADNAIVGNGSPVIVAFNVSSFVLVQPGRVGQMVSPNEGHVDVYVDGQYARMMTQVEPILLALDSGTHAVMLQLKGNDGLPLTPDVRATVTVRTTHGPATGAPGVRIVFPTAGSSTGHDVYVAVVLSNFTLVDPNGRPNAPNEGHLQVFVNGPPAQQQLSRYEPAFVVDMPDGENNITVQLVNNDNSPLSPDVSSSTTVRIKAATATLPEILNFGVSVLLIYILIVLVMRRRRASAKLAPPPEPKP